MLFPHIDHFFQHQCVQVTALLISAYSRYNPQVAEELSGSLLASGPNACVDVDALEQTPSFRHSRRQPIKSVKTHTSVQNVPVKKSKTKKHKPRLPKNFDPSVPIDKERWLPLKERSYYRRGKKRGFIGSVRGSQGAASASLMAQLDASKPSSADSGQLVCVLQVSYSKVLGNFFLASLAKLLTLIFRHHYM